LTDDQGVCCPSVKVKSLVDKLVLAYSFIFEDNIIGVQKNQVYSAETCLCKRLQDIEALVVNFG